MKYLIVIPLTVFACYLGKAQKLVLKGSEITSFKSDKFDQELFSYQIFKINAEELRDIQRFGNQPFVLHLQLGNHFSWPLELEGRQLRQEGYRLQTTGPNGKKTLPAGHTLSYTGRILHNDGGRADLTLDRGFILGAVKWQGEIYYIEPAKRHDRRAPESYFLVYKASDVKEVKGASCGTELAHHHVDRGEPGGIHLREINETCVQANIALAADFAMYSQFNDVYDLETHMLAILNLVNTNFDDEFDTGQIQFKVQTIFVSVCDTCDPWTDSSDSREFLESFTEWGTDNGFETQDYDVATLWTDRVMDDSIVGISWIGELCTDFRYNIVQDITSNSAMLRMLQSHEIGHNFGAVHDSEGSETIMNPGVNESNNWSIFSFLVINRNIVKYTSRPGCLGTCDDLVMPQASFATDVNTGCLPLAVQFENTSSGNPVSYKWIFEGGEPAISFDENPSVVYSESGNYKVTLLAANRMGQDTIEIASQIQVNFEPVAAFSFETPAGSTSAIFNTSESQNADQYLWNFGDGTVSNEQNPEHSFAESGEYEVTLTVRNDCGEDRFTAQVMVVGLPTAAFQFGETRGCLPLQVAYTNLSQTFNGSFAWSFEGGTPATSDEENPVITYHEPGIYNVSLVAISEGGNDTLTMDSLVTVFGPPETNFVTENDPGSSLVRLRDSSVNAANQIWQFDGNITVLPDNASSYDFSTSGEHEVTLITNNECGADTLSRIVEIFLLPDAAFDAFPTVGCAPLTVQFSDSSEAYRASYLWTFDGARPDTSLEQSPEFVFDVPGVYNVKLNLENAAGKDSVVIDGLIQVDGPPQAGFSMANSLGESAVAFNDTSILANTYFWDFGDGNTSTQPNPLHNYERDGTYEVKLVVENECGRDSAVNAVNVLFTPTAAFTFDQGVGCSPHDVQFTSLIGNDFGSIQWVFEGGSPNFSIEENPRVTYNEPGEFTVRLFVINSAGIDSLVLENAISISPIPTAEFEMEVSRNVVEFDNRSLFAEQYHWNFGDGQASSEMNPVHNYSKPGSYMVELMSMNNCDTVMMSRELTIEALIPRAAFSAQATEGCAPFTVNFINQSFNADTYSWQFPGGMPDSSSAESPVVTYTEPGVYSVNLMVANETGTALVEQENFITVLDGPMANFSILQSENLTLTATNLSENADSYLWNFGDGFGSQAENPTYQYSESGQYMVRLIAINDCGRDTASITIDFLIDGVDEPAWSESLRIFPNPNRGNFLISASGVSDATVRFDLFDLTGRKITSQFFQTTGERLHEEINVSGIPGGLYLLRLGNQEQQLFRKISITR